MKQRVSLTMIVRDEEHNLPACLQSARGLFDEVIVVDTGSCDRTREIAQQLGAKVHDFPWCDDFAAARNEALAHATGDWVFWLDADDRIDDVHRLKLHDLFARLGDENAAYMMRCVCPPDDSGGSATVLDHARLFRLSPSIRWRYRVHEQILPAVQDAGGSIRWTDIGITHTGYQDPALLAKKQERYLRLLRQEDEERPNNPYTLFNLGVTHLNLQRSAEAVRFLRASLERVEPNQPYVGLLYELLARAHRWLGNKEEALTTCREGLARLPDRPGLLFQQGIARGEVGDWAGAEASLLRLLQTPPAQRQGHLDPGIQGYLARHNLALVYLKQGRLADAETQLWAAAEERPDYAGTWLGLGDIWLHQGRVEELERAASRLDTDPQRWLEVALLRARAHLVRKDFRAAQQLLEETGASAPRSAWPRLLLARVLLREGREGDAETLLHEVLKLDPHNNPAREELTRLQQARKPVAAAPRRARVSLTMIVRDEEQNLPACLGPLAGLFDEVIVVDTGSRDRTREIAQQLGAMVHDFPWRDDFAAARNEALKHATGQWVFWLDADDRIDAENRARLQVLLAQLGDDNAAYMMRCVCPADGAGGSATLLDHARLFRNRPDVRWHYRVHEQILPAVQAAGGAVRWTDVSITHTGYRGSEVRRARYERNLRLALLDRAEHPTDPFVLYNLGKECLNLGRTADALEALRRSAARVAPDNATFPSIHLLLARAHYALGQKREALAACRAGRARYPDHAELLFEEGIFLCELGEYDAGEQCLTRLLSLPAERCLLGVESQGIRGHVTRHNLAMLCHRQGRLAEAEAHWTNALAERPDYSSAWFGLGDFWAAQERYDEFEQAARRLEADPRLVRQAALVRAHGLMVRGELAAARHLLEEATAAAPEAVATHVLLGHVLVREGRDWPAAERAWNAVLALEPGNLPARDNLALIRKRQSDSIVRRTTLPLTNPGRPRVSLTMIVRDEERNLPACLASAEGLFDEVIVVDTGSRDRTREIARHLGAKVHEFAWCDDFAAARNEALRHATGDWAFWLDADDRLDADNRQRLQELFARLGDENAVYMMRCLSPEDATGTTSRAVAHARLFRVHPEIRWRYRVHEQILGPAQFVGAVMHWTDVTILHTGYQEAAARRSKNERYLHLLELDCRDQPDDSFARFNLGWTLHKLGRPAEALPNLRRSVDVMSPRDGLAPLAQLILGRAHLHLGQKQEALTACRSGRASFPDDPELLFLEGQVLRELGDLPAAEARLRQLAQSPSGPPRLGVEDPGLRAFKTRHELGLVYRDQGRRTEAEAEWRGALEAQPAFLPASSALSELLADEGRWDELDTLVRRLDAVPGLGTEAAVLRARGLLARKEFATARQLLEETIAQAPSHPLALVTLSHVLLVEGRDWRAAERALRKVLALEPTNVQARQNLELLLRRHGPDAAAPRKARVSLTMIVRDEERNLPACLASADGLFDEVIVVDTGSRDRTREIAQQLGAKVHDFPWCDDFAAVRNEALAHATGDWVFWLDADDRIDDVNRPKLRELFAQLDDENAGYLMRCASRTGAGMTMVDHVRLFRNRPDVRWCHRVHEQIRPAVEAAGGTIRPVDVVIRHEGYLDAAAERRKLERNHRILGQEAAERGDDPLLLYNLARTALGLDRAAEGLAALERCLACCPESDPLLRKIYGQLARAHHRLGRRAEALAMCRRGLERFSDDAEMLFLEGLICKELGDAAGEETCLLRLLHPGARFVATDTGLYGFKAWHNLGLLRRRQGRNAEADAAWHAALAERSDFALSLLCLADLYLDEGRRPEFDDLLRRLEADPRAATEVVNLRRRAALRWTADTGDRAAPLERRAKTAGS